MAREDKKVSDLANLLYSNCFPFQCALMSDVIVGILVAALHLVNGVLGELPS